MLSRYSKHGQHTSESLKLKSRVTGTLRGAVHGFGVMPARLDGALVTSEQVVASLAEAVHGRLCDVNVRSLGDEDPHWALAAAGARGPPPS